MKNDPNPTEELGISDVQIDELNLDKECIKLPAAYLHYAHAAADAKQDVGEIKAELEVREAELGKDIRANPEKYGLDKVTESAITSTIVCQKTHKEISERLRKAQYQYDLQQAVVWALEHKKRALTLLVELHGMGYFSDPKLSEKGRKAVEDMTKRRVRNFHDD